MPKSHSGLSLTRLDPRHPTLGSHRRARSLGWQSLRQTRRLAGELPHDRSTTVVVLDADDGATRYGGVAAKDGWAGSMSTSQPKLNLAGAMDCDESNEESPQRVGWFPHAVDLLTRTRSLATQIDAGLTKSAVSTRTKRPSDS